MKLKFRLLSTLLFVLFLSYVSYAQINCDEPTRYVDQLFEISDLETEEVVFANFTSDQLWNNGDTSANNVCFDPRNYLEPQSDGTWDMTMTMIYPKATNDDCDQRASIVYLHGGGYAHLPGNNTSASAVDAYIDMARRGYVVCAINYRKGWDIKRALHSSGLGPLLPGCQNCPCEGGDANCDPYSFMKITYAMAQDARAAHRKLLNEKLTFGIDENEVFYMGASTGAVGVLHAAYGGSDMEAYQDDDNIDLQGHLGGIDVIGEEINNGSAFKIAGVTSVAGALKEGSWIEASDDIPVMFNHTTLDEAVQYCYGTILNMKYIINFVNETTHLQLEGPGRLYKDVKCLEDNTTKTKVWLRSHKGLYHNFCAPLLSSDPSDNCDELSTLEFVQRLNALFMKEIILGNEIINNHKMTEAGHVSGPCNIIQSDTSTLCSNYNPCDITSVQNTETNPFVVFPNPLTPGTLLNVYGKQDALSLQLRDIQGREVIRSEGSTLDLPSGTSAGIYYLQVRFEGGVVVEKIVVK